MAKNFISPPFSKYIFPIKVTLGDQSKLTNGGILTVQSAGSNGGSGWDLAGKPVTAQSSAQQSRFA